MSCALASPVDGVCANKRPVQGRRALAGRQLDQASLTPLAAGHEIQAAPSIAASTPFAADAPEATFSMARLHEPSVERVPTAAPSQPRAVRSAPPSFREIRSGRAAAARREPVAEVTIPVAEVEAGTLLSDAASHAPAATAAMLPSMDQLVERVRQRTAARLSRAGSFSPA